MHAYNVFGPFPDVFDIFGSSKLFNAKALYPIKHQLIIFFSPPAEKNHPCSESVSILDAKHLQ
jgi:hypothetical protein